MAIRANCQLSRAAGGRLRRQLRGATGNLDRGTAKLAAARSRAAGFMATHTIEPGPLLGCHAPGRRPDATPRMGMSQSPANKPVNIKADRQAGRLTLEWADRHRSESTRWRCACSVRALCARAKPGGRAGSIPTDAHLDPDAARGPAADRCVRTRARLGRRPRHRLLHVRIAPRELPLSECTTVVAGRPRLATIAESLVQTTRRRRSHDRRHHPLPCRLQGHRGQGPGLRPRRPKPRLRRQLHGQPPLARGRRDPRVHRAASRTLDDRRSTE